MAAVSLRQYAADRAGFETPPGYCPSCLNKWWIPDLTQEKRLHDSCRATLEKICYG